jgi:hypothetical protein
MTDKKDSKDIYNNLSITPQKIYDSFNNLVFSNDTRVIHKMLIKVNLYNQIKHLNGDIFEFGVFKGASLALWLQLIKLYEYNSLTSIVGYDFFDGEDVLDNMDGLNKKLMDDVINRCENKNDIKMETILEKCNNILPNRTKLIKGDACETCVDFNTNNPGARIKLLYLDMDVDKPTYIVLKNMWDRIVLNGIVVLDEYGFHKWDESNGVDRFLKTIKGKYKLINTNIISPTLIIEKIDF